MFVGSWAVKMLSGRRCFVHLGRLGLRMTEDLDLRRRRALYRAQHRGTKEMDFVLGRFAEARLPEMEGSRLTAFEHLLALPDPDIEAAVQAPSLSDKTDLGPLFTEIRRFHGIE